jgi:hypothetical protein
LIILLDLKGVGRRQLRTLGRILVKITLLLLLRLLREWEIFILLPEVIQLLLCHIDPAILCSVGL